MQNKKILLSVLIGISAVGTALSSFGLTKAWFASGTAFGNQGLNASSISNYFARGDGSEQNLYIIDCPRHMYNLSWLQARGRFDDVKTYFKVAGPNEEPIEIDFAGALNGTTTTTGALPPIGTDAHHFIGSFDGNGATFKNVWVSSDPNDWKERPIDIGDANTNTHVGFFGNIDQNNENKGIVRDFYLENIEVTSHITNSAVGLIAGYSNSYTENIGVKNGKLSFKHRDENYYTSEAALIGEIGSEVYWDDDPSYDGEGGNLKIDPNETKWGANKNAKFSGLTLNNTEAVPGAFASTAFVSGEMSSKSGQTLSKIYKYNTTLNFANNNGQFITANKTNSTEGSNDASIFSDAFNARYAASRTNATVMFNSTATKPNTTTTTTVQDKDGNDFEIPQNCIWYKPRKGGTCGISFKVDNMSGNSFASLYRFKRNSNGTINSSWDEIILVFNTSGGLKNNNIVYYDIEITDQEVKDGYEYCIGYSSKTTGKVASQTRDKCGKFFFLYLAGTDEHSGPSEGQALLANLDYVYRYNGAFYPSFTDETSKPNHLKLGFKFFSGADDAFMLFNMEDIENSKYVYYYTSGPAIKDAVTTNSVGVKETTTTRFPPRQQSQ